MCVIKSTCYFVVSNIQFLTIGQYLTPFDPIFAPKSLKNQVFVDCVLPVCIVINSYICSNVYVRFSLISIFTVKGTIWLFLTPILASKSTKTSFYGWCTTSLYCYYFLYVYNVYVSFFSLLYPIFERWAIFDPFWPPFGPKQRQNQFLLMECHQFILSLFFIHVLMCTCDFITSNLRFSSKLHYLTSFDPHFGSKCSPN